MPYTAQEATWGSTGIGQEGRREGRPVGKKFHPVFIGRNRAKGGKQAQKRLSGMISKGSETQVLPHLSSIWPWGDSSKWIMV